MPSVIFRTLFAETVRSWAVVVGVLLFLTLGLALSRFIGDAAAGQVPVNTVLELAAFGAIKNLEVVLPVSIFLAVLLVVGRLCRDNELAALFAGGTGLATVYRPFLVVGLIVAAIAGTLSIVVAPHTQQAMNRLGVENAAAAVQSITPGRFMTFDDGSIAFYAKSQTADGSLHDVFVRVLRKNRDGKTVQTVVTAKRAQQQANDHTRQVTLVLDDGWRYQGRPGEADYRMVKFAQHGVQLSPPRPGNRHDVDTQSTTALMASDDPQATATWQTRVSVPLSIVILTLLALPLGRVPPRSGRYGRVIVGILLYVIYVNLVHLASVAIGNGRLPGAIGEWWVHAGALAIALILIAREQGHLKRSPRRTPA